jgi:hypothetical protein
LPSYSQYNAVMFYIYFAVYPTCDSEFVQANKAISGN